MKGWNMSQKYYILEIKGIIDSKYGNTVGVYANLIREIGAGCLSFVPDVNSETQLFVFPEDDTIIEPLVRLARSQQPWEPCLDDFFVRKTFDEDRGIVKEIYRHCSFYGMNYEKIIGNKISIKVSQMKRNQLQQNYVEYMRANYMFDPIDMQVYVGRLADDDPNFFSWLFEDSSLRGCAIDELDEEYLDAWNEFYEKLDPYYDNNL